jgi:transcriptional regulator with XRE-family HTH domain
MAHPVDRFVSSRIREARISRGFTQSILAKEIGCSFQQLQKYESGNNRVSASRLYDIGSALGVPVSHFFEGYGTSAEATGNIDNITSRMLFALAQVESLEVKEKLCKMVMAIASSDGHSIHHSASPAA